MQFEDGPEIPLVGGDVTDGIVRIGDTVRRPPHAGQSSAELVQGLLRHLERVGFEGAPRFLGYDDQGRQVVTFIPGEVATRPWPAWVAEDQRVVSVARLVRRFDDAAQSFGLPDNEIVADTLTGLPPSIAAPPTFIGHRDIAPENVVFTDEVATALIDFDLARPSDRVAEVGNLLLWWAPLMPVADREPAVSDVDPFARARLMVDAYGLPDADRARLVPIAINTAERSWFQMRDRAIRLGGGWARMWNDGVGDKIRRRREWLAEHAEALNAAVTGTDHTIV